MAPNGSSFAAIINDTPNQMNSNNIIGSKELSNFMVYNEMRLDIREKRLFGIYVPLLV